MKIRDRQGHLVDVSDEACGDRPCYRYGLDKGPFTQGIGYTKYWDKPFPVCMTRHLHGCPHKPPEEGVERLNEDGSVLLKLPDPNPCCANPDVTTNPRARAQKCRSCGRRLTGALLALARGTYDPGVPVAKGEDGKWHPSYRTASGRVLTDADIEALADEAEAGYDVEQFRPRGPA